MKANQKFKDIKQDNSGYTKIVGGLVALLLIILVGNLVYWEVSDNFDFTSAEANNSSEEVDDMATTIFGLLPLIALVVVASLLIGIVISGMSGDNKGGGGL